LRHPLDLLFLGSGNAFASGRYWGCFLLNGRYLFDASPIALPHLKQADVPLEQIEAIFISHFHADHFLGLPFLLLEYAHSTERTKPLTIIGPPTIESRLETVVDASFPHLLQKPREYELNFVEVEDRMNGEAEELKWTARSVSHVDEFPCFGYRVEAAGRTLAYSGDTTMCESLVEMGDGTDVFVVECSCWEDDCGPHLGPPDVREIRRRVGPGPVLVLTHLAGGETDLGIENVKIAQDLATFRF
jgi:ribonuclease BN (tRNA processing enzyme)